MTYTSRAPVFEDDLVHTIIGHARTAAGAMRIYNSHFAGTGAKAACALKVTPDLHGQGPVDGWAPKLVDEILS